MGFRIFHVTAQVRFCFLPMILCTPSYDQSIKEYRIECAEVKANAQLHYF